MHYIPVYRLSLVRERSQPADTREIRSDRDAAEILRAHLEGADREMLVALLLSHRNRVIGLHTVSVGTLSESLVHPREVFKAAIAANAAALILAHNHPSGDPAPSPHDLATTRRLVEGGKLLGITLLDHLVTGEESWVSLKQRGLM